MNAQLNTGMQPVQFENPMGVDGFQFVEFAAPDAKLLHDTFKKMGFVAVARHKTKKITVYRQGARDILVNEEPHSVAEAFAKERGPSACGFAIRVSQAADKACDLAVKNGAEKIESKASTKAVQAPVIKGIGDCMLYLVDRYGAKGSIYDADYEWIVSDRNPKGFGLTFIDHLTHNLFFGNMAKWSDYYERLFNFREIRYFD